MSKRILAGSVVVSMLMGFQAGASVILDVDYSHLTPGDTIGDGARIQDTSGNEYHGFFGDASGTYPVVATPTGVGLDTSATTRGHVFVRDGLSVTETWYTGTTPSPIFVLEDGTDYTFESLVNWNGTVSARNGLMGQTGGSQAWMREDDGYLHYAFGVEGTLDANHFSDTIDLTAAKADGNWHNVTVVLDRTNSEIRSYLDGNLLHTNTDPDIPDLGLMLDGTLDFRVGAYNTSDPAAFNGLQDHYRISDTALDPSEFLAVIPEPASLALLAIGGLLLVFRKRR